MELFKNVLARMIVRAVHWLEGPQPKLTDRARRYDYHCGVVYRDYYNDDDYATKARNSYGDDQY